MEIMKLVKYYTVLDKKRCLIPKTIRLEINRGVQNCDAITYYFLYFKTFLSICLGIHKIEITLVPVFLGKCIV